MRPKSDPAALHSHVLLNDYALGCIDDIYDLDKEIIEGFIKGLQTNSVDLIKFIGDFSRTYEEGYEVVSFLPTAPLASIRASIEKTINLLNDKAMAVFSKSYTQSMGSERADSIIRELISSEGLAQDAVNKGIKAIKTIEGAISTAIETAGDDVAIKANSFVYGNRALLYAVKNLLLLEKTGLDIVASINGLLRPTIISTFEQGMAQDLDQPLEMVLYDSVRAMGYMLSLRKAALHVGIYAGVFYVV